MKHHYSILLTATIAAITASAVDYSGYVDWFAFSLDGYKNGQLLSDQGAVNGSWGTTAIPEGATAVVSISGATTNLVVDTINASDGISFMPNMRKWRTGKACVDMKLSFTETLDLIDPGEGAKAAFTVRTGDDGVKAFWGYSADGWTELKLPSGQIIAEYGTEYSVRVDFNDNRVSYHLLVPGGEYERLIAADDAASDFPAGGSDAEIDCVKFEGKGTISDFDGSYRNSRVTIRIRQ